MCTGVVMLLWCHKLWGVCAICCQEGMAEIHASILFVPHAHTAVTSLTFGFQIGAVHLLHGGCAALDLLENAAR